MLKKISSFSVHQTSKIVAAVYAVVAALFMILALLGFLAFGSYTLANIFQMILFGLLYLVFIFIFSYISTAIILWVYNKVAKKMGGIEVHVED